MGMAGTSRKTALNLNAYRDNSSAIMLIVLIHRQFATVKMTAVIIQTRKIATLIRAWIRISNVAEMVPAKRSVYRTIYDVMADAIALMVKMN